MSLFDQKLGHANEQSTTETTVVHNPEADREAEAASEAAFIKLEHPEAVGKVTIKGATRADEGNLVELPAPQVENPTPEVPQSVDVDHQLTA